MNPAHIKKMALCVIVFLNMNQCSSSNFAGSSAPQKLKSGTTEKNSGPTEQATIMVDGLVTSTNGGLPKDDLISHLFGSELGGGTILDVSALDKNQTLLDNSGIQGGGVRPVGSEAFSHDFSIGCEAEKLIELQISNPDDARIATGIRGEFCPTLSNKLNIVFIVDNSGSMGRHHDSKTNQVLAGNDPQVKEVNGDDTCGRLRAAQSVIRLFSGEKYKNLQTEVHVITFASAIVVNKKIKSFAESLSPQIISDSPFCETVIQSSSYAQPGGISPAGISSSTNYQAPLNAAQTLLTGLDGLSLIYFITDGNPNTPGGELNGIQVGIDAGKQLRAAVPTVTFNAVFLAATNPDEAKGILEQISGDPERVILADNANDLEKKIVLFPTFGLNPKANVATLTIPPYPAEPMKIAIMESPNKVNSWVYQTEPFILHFSPGKVVDNIVQVSAKATDGQEYKSTITIRVK